MRKEDVCNYLFLFFFHYCGSNCYKLTVTVIVKKWKQREEKKYGKKRINSKVVEIKSLQ